MAKVLLLVSSLRLNAQGPPPPLPLVAAHFSGAATTIGSGFYRPKSVALDASGNLYIADYLNNRLVKETLSGGVYTQSVLLTGDSFFRVVVDASGNLYTEDDTSVSKQVFANGSYTAVAIPTSTLSGPHGLAIDAAGDVYIADSQNNRVIKETPSGSTYTESTVASTGLSLPFDVAVDAAGNVYIADLQNDRILKETLVSGTYTETAVVTGLYDPDGVSVDAQGNLYVAVAGSGTVLLETLSGGTYTQSTILANLQYPAKAITDGHGAIFIAGSDDNTVYKVQPGGVNLGSFAVGTAAPSVPLTFTFDTAGSIGAPSVVTQGLTGLDFADAGTGTCNTTTSYAVGATCTVMVTFTPGAPGVRSGAVVLSDTSNNPLATGFVSGVGVGPLPGFDAGIFTTLGFSGLGANPDFNKVVADSAGNLYLADRGSCQIVKYAVSTSTTTVIAGTTCGTASPDGTLAAGSTLRAVRSLAINGRGDLFFSDLYRIRKIDAVTSLLSTVANAANQSGYSPDGTLGINAHFTRISALLVDGANHLYISDDTHSMVRKLDLTTGVLTTVAGSYNGGTPGFGGDGGPATSALMNGSLALALDPSGNLYTSDDGNNVIRKIAAGTGIITTAAGVAPAPYSGTTPPTNNGHDGDGGLATSAHIDDAEGLAVDSAGNLYIADSNSNVVRRVDANTQIITTLGGFYTNGGAVAPYTTDGHAGNLTEMGYAQDVTLAPDGSMYILDNDSVLVHKIAMTSAIAEFGSAEVGTATAAIDVVLTNIGNGPLALSALTTSTNFNVQGADTSCSATTTLPAAGACTLGIEFQPTMAGAPLTGTVTVADDAPSATQAVAVSGTGVQLPATQIAVSGLPTTQTSGVPLGSITADIEDVNGNVVTSSGASVTVTVTGPGGYSQVVMGSAVNGVATLDLSALPAFAAPGTYTVTTTSTGLTTATSSFVVTPAPTAFQPVSLGSVNVGASTPGTHTFTFTFAAGGMINAPSVVTQGIAGLDFTDAGTGTCDTNGTSHAYLAGDTCTVDVLFNPKAPGLRTGAVVLTDSSNNTLATGYLSGTGVGPLVGFQPAIIRTPALGLGSTATPYAIVVDPAGNVLVSDNSLCVINKYTAATQTTAVYAGTGSCTGSQSGDGGAATSARLGAASGLAIDGRGNLLFTDSHSVRSIDPATGIITTVAGTGGTGAPVAGPATSSPFQNLQAIVVDSSGNFYAADEGSHVVVKVTPGGTLSLYAGTTVSGPAVDGGLATQTTLNEPFALAIDAAANLYIGDIGNVDVRRVDATTGIISTVAGNGAMDGSGNEGPATSASVYSTEGLALDVQGNLYIADEEYSTIRVVSAADGIIHAFAGVYNGYSGGFTGDGGPANAALLGYPTGIAFDGTGTLYIADTYNYVVRTIGNPGAVPSFGSVASNNTSAALDVSVVNLGNAPLDFTALTPSANFNLNGADTTCTTTTAVAAGANCVLGVEFLPTTSGAVTGTITLADNAGTTGSGTQMVTTSGTGTPQTATQLALSGLPTAQPSGVLLGNVTASVEDANGNVVLGSTAAVTVTVTGPGGYSQVVTGTSVNGVATLNLSGLPAFTATGTYTVTTTSAGLTTATSTFTVVPPATQIAVSAPPAMLPLSGNLGSQTATVEDANGNVVPNPAATITTTVTGPGGYTQTVTATTVNGVATLNLGMLPAFTAPGTYTETTTSSTGLPPVTSTFIVGALPATQIAVSGLPTNVAFGGNLGTVTATLENVNGGVATGSTAVVTATITGPGGFSQVVTGTTVNGVVSLNLSGLALTTPGTYTVAVTSPNLATSTSTITVAAATGGQAAQLAVTGLPAQLGQSSNLGHITASVETSTGAVVTTSAASVTLTLTGPGGYTQMVTVAAVNGVAGFDLSGFSFTALGTYTLTVTSPGLPAASYTFTVAQDFTLAAGSGSGGSPTVTVLPGAPATFALTLAPAGTTFTQPITLSATGLPPGATYSFNPPIVTPGPSAATSTLTITTATTTAALRHLTTRGGVTGLALAALLLPFGSRRLRRSAKRLSASGLVAMLLTLAGLGALTGCAKHGFYGQTPQTYVVTVTATSGSFSHSTTVTLTEQ